MQISEVKGIGEKLSKIYARLGIKTVSDLLFHLPKNYIDFSNLNDLSSPVPGAFVAVGRISVNNARYSKNRRHMTEATLNDEAGAVKLVWFNQPYRAKSLKPDTKYLVMGELEFAYGSYQVINPDIEEYVDESQARIVANYPLTKGLTNKSFRKHIKQAINQGALDTIEHLPEAVRQFSKLDLKTALKQIHMPSDITKVDDAKQTLKFWELFALSLASELLREEYRSGAHYSVEYKDQPTQEFVKSLNFKLTDDQRAASWEIIQDMSKKHGLNRLLNGDVGSGKTVVAEIAALNVIENGYQCCLVAPTTVLANQHFQDISKQFDVELLVSSMPNNEKERIKSDLESGKINFVIATHAAFQSDVKFKNLGLVIVDEQHRFGVDQRRMLLTQKTRPHMLSMSATPIPRSLALTLYGDLEVSKIKQMPAGRKPVETILHSSNSRKDIFGMISKEVEQGHQVYVVCPAIEQSDTHEMMSVDKAESLYKKEFKDCSIGTMHSKLDAEAKDQMMQDFTDGKIDILISTTVIEVGVNVANANLMIIEDAERFGLAQLHQLRGRVGRSSKQAKCILLTSQNPVSARLRAMTTTNNGFELAELDLKLRGPGAIYGKYQSGQLDLRIATLDDLSEIDQAKKAAKSFMQSQSQLIQYPQLKSRVDGFKQINYLN